MAANGLVGYRTAADVLMEISFHLIEQVCFTTLTSYVGPGGYGTGAYGGVPGASGYGYGSGPPEVVLLASNNALYVGAMIVIGWGLSTQEVVTVLGIAPNGFVYMSAFANAHNPGEIVLGPTFPTQETTDPFYRQEEMLTYLARAQAEFLTDCPCYYEFSQQPLTYGQIIQATPSNCIEINRVAASQFFVPITSITIASNEATVVTGSPHGLQVGSSIFIQSPVAGFGGVFELDSVPSPTSFTYPQIKADGTAAGGSIYYFSRLYEVTQTELTMANRTWRNDYVGLPQSWFEDRTGLYKWGTGGKPASNFQAELLCSIRDTDTLGLLDGFLVNDVLVPALKYKTLAFAFGKDGVQQDPTRAAYCEDRYKRYVAATNRFLVGMSLGLKGGQ
jgi:hypothetical protein